LALADAPEDLAIWMGDLLQQRGAKSCPAGSCACWHWHYPSIGRVMAATTLFIIHGVHITENLQHHKANDVRRILEEKGFKEGPSGEDDEATHFYPATGETEHSRQTTVRFEDGDFVADGGVSHSG
jgi:hypothetical protein